MTAQTPREDSLRTLAETEAEKRVIKREYSRHMTLEGLDHDVRVSR